MSTTSLAEVYNADTPQSKYPAIPEYDSDLEFGSINEAINTYVATRDDLDRERKQYNTYEAKSKNFMDRIEMWIKDKADELGVDSFKTQSGTAYRNVKTYYKMSDWESYKAWMIETGNLHCVEKRAAKLAVKEIHDATGEVPPGLLYEAEVCFDVRRPSK